jgi:hypothetical protein
MKDLFKLILGVLTLLFKSRAKLAAEILILRQQINVLRRRAPQRRHLNNTDLAIERRRDAEDDRALDLRPDGIGIDDGAAIDRAHDPTDANRAIP